MDLSQAMRTPTGHSSKCGDFIAATTVLAKEVERLEMENDLVRADAENYKKQTKHYHDRLAAIVARIDYLERERLAIGWAWADCGWYIRIIPETGPVYIGRPGQSLIETIAAFQAAKKGRK